MDAHMVRLQKNLGSLLILLLLILSRKCRCQDASQLYMKIKPSPARIYPGADAGTHVATVIGYDANKNPPDSFLLRSTGLNYFSISSDGLITTTRTVSDVIDYTYEIDVYVNFGKSTRVNLLTVIVSEKNEFAPVFDRPIYNFLVYRQEKDDIVVGLLKTRDGDSIGYNKDVEYALIGSNDFPFVSVHPQLGKVTVHGKTMPRDKAYFAFNVTVTNTGSPPLMSSADVVVDVTDLAAPRTFCLYVEFPIARVCWKNPIKDSYVDHYRLSFLVSGMNQNERNVTVNAVDSITCTNVTFSKFGDGIDFYLLLFNGDEWSPYSNQQVFTIMEDGWLGKDCDGFSACLVFQPCLNGGNCLTGEHNTYTCNCTESWKGSECQDFDMCSTDPCRNGGICTYISNYTYSCTCNHPYYGENCELVDDCVNITCMNNGKCVRMDNGESVCECVDHWSGRFCEQEDPCKPSPCIKGACYNINSTNFACECFPGYSGELCEFYDQCLDSNPCRNNGECYSEKGVALCRCPADTLGKMCEFTNACMLFTAPCDGNGECVPIGNIFVCNCSIGYYGRECQYLNMCAYSPCKNGACVNTSSSEYKCICKHGYYSKDCDLYDYCVDDPCKDLGMCTKTSNDYTCECFAPERYGKNCELIDGCQINECDNGGVCVSLSTTGEFKCNCLPGFYDASCTSLDGCWNTPCQHGGKCTNTTALGDYTCECPSPEYFGDDCELRDYCYRNPCENNKTCITKNNGYHCVCPEDKDCTEPCKINPEECNGSAKAARQLNELLSLTDDPSKVNASLIDKVAGVLDDIYPYTLKEPDIANGMASVASNILLANDSVLEDTAKGQAPEKIIDILDRFTTDTSDNTSVTTKNIQLFSMDLDPTITTSLAYNLPLLDEEDEDKIEPSGISISIPEEAIEKAANGSTELFRVKFMSFRSAGFFISPEGSEEVHFKRQKVATASFGGKIVENLTSPVVYAIHNIETGRNHTCVFWNTIEKRWSTEGIKTEKTNGNETKCHSIHLTSFAILLDPAPSYKLSEIHETILTYISYIGVAISIICIIMSILTYSLFRCLNREKSGRILLNLLAALLLLNISFILGAEKVLGDGDAQCVITAICLHYFLLATLFWMAVEAVNMYQLLVTVFAKYSGHFLLKRCVVAWGAPAVIVAITASVDLDNYRSENDFCFLSSSKPYAYYSAILVPACIILAINTFVFIKVSWVIMRPGFKGNINATNQQITPAQVRGAFTVLILVGVTWVLGPLAINEAKLVFNYLFCILNSLQGCFIFIFRCLLNPEARAAWIQLVKTGTFKSRRGLVKSITDTSKSHSTANRPYGDTTTYKTQINDSNVVSENSNGGWKGSGTVYQNGVKDEEGFSKV